MKTVLPILIALLAGAFMPLQAGINAMLRKHLSDPIQAAFISFFVGTLVLLGYILAARPAWPSWGEMADIPRILWIGGALGAFFVAVTIYLAPRIGATTMTALLLAGQLLASLIFDQFGLVGYPQHPISFWRVAGAVLLGIGVWMIKAF